MQPRSWALLTFAGGIACLALAASAQQQSLLAARAGPPNPAQSQALAIDWGSATQQTRSAVNERGQGVNAKFVAANRQAIDKTAIPVLLPSDPSLAGALRFFPNGAVYTVSASTPGLSFVMTGAGRAFPLSARAARDLSKTGGLKGRIPADGIEIEQTEAGIDASFSRFGASYSISLECANSHADPRCKDDSYVRGLIGRLMVVIPGGAHGQ